jgi:putative transposase
MTTAYDIDWPQVLADRLTSTRPDLLRELLLTFIHTLMGPTRCGRDLRRAQHRAHQSAQWISPTPVRHPDRGVRSSDPQIATGLLFPRLAAGAPQTSGAGADHGGGHVLPSVRLDSADGQARGVFASLACPRRKSAWWPRGSTPLWRRFARGPSMVVRTRSWPPMRWCSRWMRTAGWSTCTP